MKRTFSHFHLLLPAPPSSVLESKRLRKHHKRLPACVPAPTALHLKRAVFKPTDPDSYFMSSSSFVTPSLLHMNREFLSKCEPENMNVDAVECLPMLTATSVPAGSYVTKMGDFISAWCYWLICERLFRVSKCSIVQRVQYRTLHESLKILSWWEKLCFACVKWRSWKRLDNETFSYPTVHFRNTLWFADTKPYYQPRRLIYSTVCLKTWLRHSETASFYSTTKSLRQKRKEKNWLLLLCWGRPRILSST